MTELPKVGKPALRALGTLGVITLEQVAQYSERELLALHGFGPRAIRILAPALAEHGLSLRPD